ncbi:MAG: choice-of-anchor X domain-containing protein [Chloroflexota bacterium]
MQPRFNRRFFDLAVIAVLGLLGFSLLNLGGSGQWEAETHWCEDDLSDFSCVAADGTEPIPEPPTILSESYAGFAQNEQVAEAHFSPFAVKADGSESSTLLVTLAETAQSVSIQVPGASIYAYLDGSQLSFGDRIELYDDGSNGDAVANDNIWSRGGFTHSSEFVDPGDLTPFHLYDLTITTAESVSVVDVWGSHTLMLVAVSPEEVTAPLDVAPQSLQVGTHAYNSYASGAENLLASSERDGLVSISNDLFSYLEGDDIDFILVFPTTYLENGAFGRAYPVMNSDQHTGRGIYDFTAEFGSPGALKQAIVMNFTGTNGPTLHEIMHQWAAFGLSDLGFHSCGSGSHWGRVGVGRGQLGGFDPTTLVDNGDGTYTVGSHSGFANGGDSVVYADIEMYLMGMIPASEVDPIPVPINIDCDSLVSVDGGIQFAADGIREVTIEEIQAALGGARLPTSDTAQKAFKVAFVAVSDGPLSPTELAVFNSRAQILSGELGSSFLNSFPDATNNLGSIDTTTKQSVSGEAELDINVLGIEPAKPRPGDSVDFTFELENVGSLSGSGMAITLTIPTEVTYDSVNLPSGVSLSRSGQALTFEIDSIDVGETLRIQVTYGIPNALTDSTSLAHRFSSVDLSDSSESEYTVLINELEIFVPFLFSESVGG